MRPPGPPRPRPACRPRHVTETGLDELVDIERMTRTAVPDVVPPDTTAQYVLKYPGVLSNSERRYIREEAAAVGIDRLIILEGGATLERLGMSPPRSKPGLKPLCRWVAGARVTIARVRESLGLPYLATNRGWWRTGRFAVHVVLRLASRSAADPDRSGDVAGMMLMRRNGRANHG
jgi:hypothetical protein